MTIVRTAFGITTTALRAHYYDAEDPFDIARERMLRKHREEIADRKVVRGPTLIDETIDADGGLNYSWVSEVEA